MGQQPDMGHENFYASSLEGSDTHPAMEDRRSRRQSRVSREIVSQGKAIRTQMRCTPFKLPI